MANGNGNGNSYPDRPTWTDTQQSLAYILNLSFILILMIWMFRPPSGDAGSMAILNSMIGILGAAVVGVNSFYFGSNKDSKSKDATINQMASNAGTGSGTAALTAAAMVAPAAAAAAAPPAAAVAAPPAAEAAAPAAAEKAVADALKKDNPQ